MDVDRVGAALVVEGLPATIWQHHPIPAHSTFRRHPARPWHPSLSDRDLQPWDPAEYPVAQRICDSSLVLGHGGTPISVQPPETVERYATAIRKVVDHLDELLAQPFEQPESTRLAAAFNRSGGREGVPAALTPAHG